MQVAICANYRMDYPGERGQRLAVSFCCWPYLVLVTEADLQWSNSTYWQVHYRPYRFQHWSSEEARL